MRRLHRFLRLAPVERRLLIEASLGLAAARLGLAVLSFGRLVKVLDTLSRLFRLPQAAAAAESSRIGWAVSVASRHIPVTNSCLPRALAAQILLTRRNRPARLQLGVCRDTNGSRLLAHAWVESETTIVIGGPDPRAFMPLRAGAHKA